MLLAAGDSSRLRPFTDQIPKPMLSVCGRPILEHNLRLLRKHGVQRVIVNLHHAPHAITSHFGDGAQYGLDISYSYEESLLGTAGGVRLVLSEFPTTFAVLYGDNLLQCDLTAMARFHEEKRAEVTIGLFHREDVHSSGIVGIDDQGRVLRFLEKPSPREVFSRWVNAGVLILDPSALDSVEEGLACDFGRELLPALIAQGRRVFGYPIGPGLWWIDSPEDYRRTLQMAEQGVIKLSH
jgi:NDP-sugar pyrophosphorylase family protein